MKEAIKLAIEDGIEDLEKYKDEEIYLDCLRIKNNEVIEILESLGYKQSTRYTYGKEKNTKIFFQKEGHPNLVFDYGGLYAFQHLYCEKIEIINF